MSGYAITFVRPDNLPMQYSAPPAGGPPRWDLSNLDLIDRAVLRAFCRALADQIDAEEQG